MRLSVWDATGKILLWNEGARRLYGYESNDVIGKANISVCQSPEELKDGRFQGILETTIRDGKWDGILVQVRNNGQNFTARLIFTPRRDANGRNAGILLVAKDISDEIRVTDQLKATQFYTRSLIESNIDALMTTDSLGIITGRKSTNGWADRCWPGRIDRFTV